MTSSSPTYLSDRELLAETRRVVAEDRRTTSELVALLAEVDARKLYRGEGHSSLFGYCTQVLHLSESAAYSRIAAARTARAFPGILTRLADGDVTLTTITLLAPHLTEDNHEALLDAARHKSKRDVERLVAAVDPQPDIPSSIRRAPKPAQRSMRPIASAPRSLLVQEPGLVPDAAPPSAPVASQPAPLRPAHRPTIAPIAPARYFVKCTVGQGTHDKLQRARDLLRHSIPDGDPAAIIDRALTVLIAELEKTKHAATRRPRTRAAKTASARHVPAAVKRTVWARDEGRCAFVGGEGRCPETGFLEFHHAVPFAAGGTATVENLELRCRSHNAHEAEQFFGPDLIGRNRTDRRREKSTSRKPGPSTLAGQSRDHESDVNAPLCPSFPQPGSEAVLESRGDRHAPREDEGHHRVVGSHVRRG